MGNKKTKLTSCMDLSSLVVFWSVRLPSLPDAIAEDGNLDDKDPLGSGSPSLGLKYCLSDIVIQQDWQADEDLAGL